MGQQCGGGCNGQSAEQTTMVRIPTDWKAGTPLKVPHPSGAQDIEVAVPADKSPGDSMVVMFVPGNSIKATGGKHAMQVRIPDGVKPGDVMPVVFLQPPTLDHSPTATHGTVSTMDTETKK
mmetsp:Transcript_80663/g.250354  ORF Transcript_80663/g.250354 Transcript_80663/m.250354 type:complete len:121 (+) Transcript_80663:65-427(+)